MCFLCLSVGASEQGQFHALNVLEWKDVKTSAGAQVQLLQIRNPWGRRCWEGAWTERWVRYFPDYVTLFFAIIALSYNLKL